MDCVPSSMTRKKQTGFTLIELIVVLVILGILSSIGFSRFASVDSFRERGFTDETLTAIRYARKLATTSGCHVEVSLDNNQLAIGRWTVCTPQNHGLTSLALRHPKNTGDFINTVPKGLSVSNVRFYFDGSGRPYDANNETVFTSTLIINIGSRNIRIEPETGFSWQ